MNEHALLEKILDIIRNFGDLGVFLGMALESSIVPIPSEAVVVGAGAIGIPIWSIVIFGSLGSTCGGMVGYLLGRYGAMPVILRYGKFILIKPHHIEKAEKFAKKYGPMSVLIGRVLPIVPFKVFSIAAGMTGIPFVPFVVWTTVGVVPRMILLAYFGSALVKYTKPAVLVLAGVVVIYAAYKLSRKFYNGNNKK